jgi:hypothetical protein
MGSGWRYSTGWNKLRGMGSSWRRPGLRTEKLRIKFADSGRGWLGIRTRILLIGFVMELFILISF